jgi:hypothetical protein
LGAANLLLVSPALRRAGDSAMAWAGRLRITVSSEAFLAIVVMGAAAFLTNSSPPFDTGAAPTENTGSIQAAAAADDLVIDLSIDPGRAGQNDLTFSIEDTDGDEAAVLRFAVRFSYVDQQLGETEDLAVASDANTFRLRGSQLSLPGAWRIAVIVRREGLRDTRVVFEVDVPAETATPAEE